MKTSRLPHALMCAVIALALAACSSASPTPAGGAPATAASTPATGASTPATGATTPATAASTPATGASTPAATSTSGAPPAAGGMPADACTLVTEAEVEQATGFAYTPGTSVDTSNALDNTKGVQCTYAGDFTKQNYTNVVVFVTQAGQDETIAGAKLAFPDGKDVAGLGQAAFWDPSSTKLWVDLSDNLELQISLVLFDTTKGTDYLPVAQGLATIAIGRL